MSHSATLCVGFKIGEKQIPKKYRTKLKEKSVREQRYDPKTGKPTHKEKVVTVEGGEHLRLDGDSWPLNETHTIEPFIGALAEKLSQLTGFNVGHTAVDDYDGPFLLEPPGDNDAWTFSNDGCSIPFDKLVKFLPQLVKLQEAIDQPWFRPG